MVTAAGARTLGQAHEQPRSSAPPHSCSPVPHEPSRQHRGLSQTHVPVCGYLRNPVTHCSAEGTRGAHETGSPVGNLGERSRSLHVPTLVAKEIKRRTVTAELTAVLTATWVREMSFCAELSLPSHTRSPSVRGTALSFYVRWK